MKNKQGVCFFYKIHEILFQSLESFRKNSKKIFKRTRNKYNRLEEFLQNVFEILKLIIEKNNDHKKILFEHIDLFIHQIDHNLGQMELICEIFENNPDLLTKIDKEFLLKFKNIICLFGQKPRFLEIFLAIQKNEDDYIIPNQIIILDFFFDNFMDENYNLFFFDIFFDKNKYFGSVKEEIDAKKFYYQTDIFDVLDYTMKLLEVYLF